MSGTITPRMVELARQVIEARDEGIAPLNVPAQALATEVVSAAPDSPLPCPWCGSPVRLGGCYVECSLRECFAMGPTCGTREGAIAAWNAVVSRIAPEAK